VPVEASERPYDPEPTNGPWLRGIAAITALGAGLIHIGVLKEHLSDGWMVAGFFIVVALIQLTAAGLLLRPRPALWLWLGILGSAAVIGIWIASRTVGLPLIGEANLPEPVGLADSAASLMEATTILALALWIRARSRPADRRGVAAATGAMLGLAFAWWVARAFGGLSPDPRLAIAVPELVDRVLVAFALAVATLLVLMWPAITRSNWWTPVMRGLLAAVGVLAIALVFLSFPVQGGQNVGCRYAPLAEFSERSHEDRPEPIRLAAGVSRWLPLLSLTACPGQSVRLTEFDVLNARGSAAQILELRLLPVGEYLDSAGAAAQPAGAEAAQDLPVIREGETRQMVLLVRARGEGTFNVDSVRIAYRLGNQAGQFNFATILSVCEPRACPAAVPAE
jgi:hypothetical protein